MKLAIKVTQIDSDDFIAEVDWTKGDAGQVGTPGAVCYGPIEQDAYTELEASLQAKGHTVIQ